MSTLDDHRGRLNPEQQMALNAIWRCYIEHGKWIPHRVLHAQCGGKAAVRQALQTLGGSIAFESRDQGSEVYQFTLLGALLTDAGPEAQRLLLRYLEWVRQMALRDPEMNHVESGAVQAALNLSTEETQTLGRLILLGNFWGGTASHGASEWKMAVPHDVEDIPEDVETYLEQKILKDYDVQMPFEEGPRRTYQWDARPSTTRQEVSRLTGAVAQVGGSGPVPLDVLHPRLHAQVYDALMRGDYETAVFQAFLEVEIAVREAAGCGPDDIGVRLMRQAFRPCGGPLADPSLPPAERDATTHLFAGAIGLFKNPRSHRREPITDSVEALELVLLASHLLRIVARHSTSSTSP